MQFCTLLSLQCAELLKKQRNIDIFNMFNLSTNLSNFKLLLFRWFYKQFCKLMDIFKMFNTNIKLNNSKMLIFRCVYKQFCVLMTIFNIFHDRYESESFQSQVRRVDACHWVQPRSNAQNTCKINRK